jgi:23S rRNA (cytosine1962-C5)-methyltransferase
MKEKQVILKPGKDKAIKNKHHWIFSGAIASLPEFTDGDILKVYSAQNEFVGSAYFNRKSAIIGRMVSFDETPPLTAVQMNLDAAIKMRSSLFEKSQTNAYRLVNGEGDFLPGLIVDRYNDVLVIQITTLGMEKMQSFVTEYLVEKLAPRAIYEKSNLPSRKQEGLAPVQRLLYGSEVDEIEVLENGLRFCVSIVHGQKTGFFLDHREMREWVRQLSKGKTVLNCFAYSGAFSVYAASGGAKRVDSIDISDKAMDMARRNMALNHLCSENGYFVEDAFEFLRKNTLQYDLVILDPPAFAKKKNDVIAACRGYKDINRVTLQKLPAGSMLLTSSCSYHVNEELFQQVIFQASVEAGRKVQIIGSHRMAMDHPINICHPESDYLKSLLLYVY